MRSGVPAAGGNEPLAGADWEEDPAADPVTADGPGYLPGTARDLWRLLNRVPPLEPRVTRILSTILMVAYTLVSVARVLKEGPAALLWVRFLVPLWASIGALFGPRFGVRTLRCYIVGAVVVLGVSTSYIEAVRGYQAVDLALMAVATIAALPFVATGRDLVATNALLIAGNAAIFAAVPPRATPVDTIWMVLVGAMGVGTAVGVFLLGYRRLTYEGLLQFQQSLARERALRGFAERAASLVTGSDLLHRLASRLQETTGGGGCLLLFRKPADGALRVVARVCADPHCQRHPAVRATDLFAALGQKLEAQAGPLTHAELEAEELRALAQTVAPCCAPRGVAVLPVRGFLPGMIVLLAPAASAITSERLRMWQAMASQAGIAAANAHAWEELREQEASARHLAEERGRLAEMRTRFISMTSHEFRTPLTAILAASESLDRYGERMTAQQRRDRLVKIKSQVKQMTELLGDLLVLGRAETGRLPFVPEPLDLERLCREMLAEVRATAATSHELVLSIAGACPEFHGDPKLLRQIVGNLLTNAVKYSPDGGRVALELARHDGAVVLRVRDQGIGVLPEDREALFEAFHRGANVGKIPGSGLGLAITQKAVELHGGRIAVESAAGAGTTFEVTLPSTPPGPVVS